MTTTKIQCKACKALFGNWGTYASHACKQQAVPARARPVAPVVAHPAPRDPVVHPGPATIHGEFRIITINLSDAHVKALKVLQDLRVYPSRSEAIRVAVRDLLIKLHQPGRGHVQDVPVVASPSGVDAARVARLINALQAEPEVTA